MVKTRIGSKKATESVKTVKTIKSVRSVKIKTSKIKKKNSLPKPLTLKQVYAPCPINLFKFKTTAEIKSSHEFIAQKRAVRAIDVGLGIRRPGYNIYVAGYQGTGKTSVIRAFLEKWSKDAKTPSDWVYVYNFQQMESPDALELPSGRGSQLAKLMDEAIKDLKKEIPQALQSEDYENAVNSRLSQNNDKQSRFFSDLEKLAKSMNFQIKSTRLGIETIPIVDGRALTEKEYNKLTESERTSIEESRSKLEPQVLEFARQVRALELDAKEFVNKLQRDIGKQVISHVLSPVFEAFSDMQAVTTYLRQVEEDILDNLLDFVDDDSSSDEQAGLLNASHDGGKKDRFRKYKVNLFIDNKNQKGAPVVLESNPTYYNLFGKVEKNVEHGMFLTDFCMIKPGAIHKANGGYIVLEAGDVLKMPHVWDTLKRVLRNRQGFIEDMGEQFSMFPTSGLRPRPIPLDLKVIFIGTDEIYHLLHELDEEFAKLFKIKADFDFKMPRTLQNMKSYVSFIATRSHKEDLLHFDRSGVAAIIEYSSRLIEDQNQLTTQFGEIKDLTIEADFIAREQGSKIIKRSHVEEAINQKFYRVNLYEHHLMEMLAQEDIMISVDGQRVGQVNGLAVYDLGDYMFGKIGRITCTTAVTDDGIVNIERASKLSGNIHDKGMYILTGYLNALLAKEHSLGFSASICFEQSYGIVDGDSATIAELVAVISAMAEVSVRQNIAITGSLNQFGDVQAVGGINEKIEGFYKSYKLVGKAKGGYGVIIPYQNVNNLMLNTEVRKAIMANELSIYPVKYFWEAFEIATGVPLGASSVLEKEFPFGSALALIKARVDAINVEHKEVHTHEHTQRVVDEDQKAAKSRLFKKKSSRLKSKV